MKRNQFQQEQDSRLFQIIESQHLMLTEKGSVSLHIFIHIRVSIVVSLITGLRFSVPMFLYLNRTAHVLPANN